MPKVARVDVVVAGTPSEVAARLRRVTRFRLFPYQGSVLGGGARPLGGRVDDQGFRVALDPWDLLQRSQAVAVGTLLPEGSLSTRVVAEVGLPLWLTWMYRFGWILAVMIGVGVAGAATTWGLSTLAALGIAGLFLFASLVGTTLGIGWHVAHANGQVGALAAAVRGALGAQPEVEEVHRVAQRVPEG